MEVGNAWSGGRREAEQRTKIWAPAKISYLPERANQNVLNGDGGVSLGGEKGEENAKFFRSLGRCSDSGAQFLEVGDTQLSRL